MKYPKPKLFKPTEKEFTEAANKISEFLSDKIQIVTSKGKTIQGKRKSN